MKKYKHIKIWLSIFVIFLVFSIACLISLWFSMAKISDAIVEKDIVFIPDKLAKNFYHQFLLTDAYDYWIVEPDESDVLLLHNDIETGNWEKLDSHHLELLYDSPFAGSKKLSSAITGKEVYVCFYNWLTDEIITNETNFEPWMTTQYLFFIYNAETNLYYCIYYSY